MVKYGSKKKRNLVAFFKLFLCDVKVESSLISRHFFCGFSNVPRLPSIYCHPDFYANESCWGGTYAMQISFTSDLSFPSFHISKIFLPNESTFAGCFWVVFHRSHTLLNSNLYKIFTIYVQQIVNLSSFER